jgi:hypothetical protein
MLAVMRKQPKGTRSEVMEVTNLLMQMQSFEDEFRNYPPDQAFPIERALEFYNFMVPFVAAINEMARKINGLKEDFDKEFKARGIDLSSKETH